MGHGGGDAANAHAAPAAGRRRLLEQVKTDCDVGWDSKTNSTVTNICYPIGLSGGGVVLYVLGVLYLFVAIAIVCDEFFVPALERLTEVVGVSDDVAGATFMAAGGSAPELFTSAIGTFSVPPSAVGFGTIVGSAVFNVLFVIGMCAVFSKEILELTWWPLARDSSYYTISLLVLAFLFSSGGTVDGKYHKNVIELWESIVLLGMYLGYVILMKYNARLHQWVEGRIAARKKVVEVMPEPASPATPDATNDDARERSGTLSQAEAAERMAGRVGSGTRKSMAQMGLEQQKSAAQLNAFLRPATFRGGVLQLLISQKGFMDRVSNLVITGIRGNVDETFKQIDTDGSGCIEQGELKALLDVLVYPDGDGEVSKEEVESVLEEVDVNHDGQVSISEFRTWYDKSEMRVKSEMSAVFDTIDTEHSGEIWKSNVKQLLERLSGRLSDEQVAEIWAEATGDVTGQVSKLTRDKFQAWYEQSMLFKENMQRQQSISEEEEESHLMLHWPAGRKEQVMFVVLAPIMFSLSFTVPDVRNERWQNWYPFSFVMAIVWVGIYSFFMVEFATLVGHFAGIPTIVMGLTFLAAGTSIPDLLTSVIVARQGLGDMAVSSSIGSNIFDVLVGLPLPWCLFCAIKGKSVAVEASSLTLSILILVGMLVCVIVTIVASGWKMTKRLGYSMFLLYAIFVVQQLLREDW